MRWYKKEKLKFRDKDIRYKSQFLLFPLTIGNETRWLESVIIEQEYVDCKSIYLPELQWVNKKFVDPSLLKESPPNPRPKPKAR